MLKIETPVCPECEAEVAGIMENLACVASIDYDGDNIYQYSGDTDIDWNTQAPQPGCNGFFTVVCSNGHKYQSQVRFPKGEADATS